MRVQGTQTLGRAKWWVFGITLGIILGLGVLVHADEIDPNATCLSCHDTEGFSTTLDNGQEMNLFVSGKSYIDSVHGAAGLTCDNCHDGYVEYPHPEQTYTSVRGFALQANAACANCHTDEAASFQNDFHGKTALIRNVQSTATGKSISNAPEATCTDCHGTHNILPASDPASPVNAANLTATCQQCHEKATPKFVAAFANHQTPKPSGSNLAVTYWINMFYAILIPVLIISLVLFIILELVFMLRQRRTGPEHS